MFFPPIFDQFLVDFVLYIGINPCILSKKMFSATIRGPRARLLIYICKMVNLNIFPAWTSASVGGPSAASEKYNERDI